MTTQTQNPAAFAPGLHYLPELLSPQQQQDAVRHVDAAVDQWRNDLRRRTQHYGWIYDYRAKVITPDQYLGALPDWLRDIAANVYENAVDPETGARLFDRMPEQCIVNEYVGAQGIAEHTDHPGFGPAIATVSLISEWPMLFAPRYRQQTRPVSLKTGSCLTMTGPSRHVWTHQIERDRRRPRTQRRLSLTFRTVLNRDNVND